jgi:excisionase family DNA binding protein
MDNESTKDFMTVQEAAIYVRMCETNFRKLVNSARCTFAIRLGRRIVIKKDALLRFMDEQTGA